MKFSLLLALFLCKPLLGEELLPQHFAWTNSGPLIDVGRGRIAVDPHVSVKDPSFVFHEGAWHLFTTVRMRSGRVDMEYLTFKDWNDASKAERHVLNLYEQYNAAAGVLFHTAQEMVSHLPAH
jgi:hypothetical protein